jgi:HPt (histidine-containing phosphotransfer) domain-containing protein
MDIRSAAENLGLTEDSYRSLLEIFVRESRADLRRLRAAMAAGDSVGVAEAAHSLRGAAGNLDLEEITLPAGKLESRARAGSLEGASAFLALLAARLETLAGLIAP